MQVSQMGECEKTHLPEAECYYNYFLLCRTSSRTSTSIREQLL